MNRSQIRRLERELRAGTPCPQCGCIPGVHDIHEEIKVELRVHGQPWPDEPATDKYCDLCGRLVEKVIDLRRATP